MSMLRHQYSNDEQWGGGGGGGGELNHLPLLFCKSEKTVELKNKTDRLLSGATNH